MSGLKTSYEFTLPRGYVDRSGQLHRTGTMRLATARDELEPMRDPGVKGPDDPRLTILVLARVIERIGDVEHVTQSTIEQLFAVDLAFLQDFYGVINFGDQDEFEALIRSQQQTRLVGDEPAAAADPAGTAGDRPAGSADGAGPTGPARPRVRAAVEEFSRQAQ